MILDDEVAGAIALGDVVREESREAIEKLKDRGVKVMMITGDSTTVARAVAEELGLDDYFAEVLVNSDPRDVLHIVSLAQGTYRKMVQNLWWASGYNIVAIPLVARRNGLEQWKPVVNQPFPVSSGFVAETLLPILGLADYSFGASRDKYTMRDLVTEVARPHFGLFVASGMNDYENVSYPLAIKRILGLQPLPDDVWYGFNGNT